MQETPSVATIECPYCSEVINAKSKKCRHCGEILDHQMREIELLKSQRNSPNVFMNAGGAAAAASSASSSSSGGEGNLLRRFPHWIHILITIVTGGLWFPVYLLMYLFRNKRYYY
jgi:hypothetical protein